MSWEPTPPQVCLHVRACLTNRAPTAGATPRPAHRPWVCDFAPPRNAVAPPQRYGENKAQRCEWSDVPATPAAAAQQPRDPSKTPAAPATMSAAAGAIAATAAAAAVADSAANPDANAKTDAPAPAPTPAATASASAAPAPAQRIIAHTLWLCLECGHCGCSRQTPFSSGNGHAIAHGTTARHHVVVRLATVQPVGGDAAWRAMRDAHAVRAAVVASVTGLLPDLCFAPAHRANDGDNTISAFFDDALPAGAEADAYCYACNDDVALPPVPLMERLCAFGFRVATARKSAPSTAEWMKEENRAFQAELLFSDQ